MLSTLAVRTYECDAYGHVNHAVYLHYLEFARNEYLKSLGFDYQRFIADGYGILVSRVDISYKSPALPDQLLTIETTPVPGRPSVVSGTLRQTIRHESRLVAEALVTWVVIGPTGRPTRPPAPYASLLLSPVS